MGIAAISGAISPVPPLPVPVGPAAADVASGASFGTALAEGLQNVQRLQDRSDELAVSAVTGSLQDVHDYTIAASQAAVATELTVALRNKAVEAFSEIMRMPL